MYTQHIKHFETIPKMKYRQTDDEWMTILLLVARNIYPSQWQASITSTKNASKLGFSIDSIVGATKRDASPVIFTFNESSSSASAQHHHHVTIVVVIVIVIVISTSSSFWTQPTQKSFQQLCLQYFIKITIIYFVIILILLIITMNIIIITNTRPKPPYGRQGLAGSWARIQSGGYILGRSQRLTSRLRRSARIG